MRESEQPNLERSHIPLQGAGFNEKNCEGMARMLWGGLQGNVDNDDKNAITFKQETTFSKYVHRRAIKAQVAWRQTRKIQQRWNSLGRRESNWRVQTQRQAALSRSTIIITIITITTIITIITIITINTIITIITIITTIIIRQVTLSRSRMCQNPTPGPMMWPTGRLRCSWSEYGDREHFNDHYSGDDSDDHHN